MATISETELQRRLRALERSTGGSQKIFVSDIDPSGTGYVDGDTHYNSATGNLWLFSDGSWGLSVTRLHIRYADSATNLSTAGIAPAQNDITGFSELPYTSAGVQKAYRGLWFGGAVASTDPTDYEWTLTAGESGAVPTYERYYSTTAGLLSQMGDPDTAMSGVTWVSISGAAPSTAYWIAERFTIDGVVSAWQVYPVQAKDGGIPFVTYTKLGYNMPTLGDSTWISDSVVAVSNFTGRAYTNQKEFGYGTTVVITYDNGKLYGTLKRSGGQDVWVLPASFIDGNLLVDGTVAAQHIAATSIDATKLVVSGGNAINYSTVGADPTGASAAAQAAAEDTASAALTSVTDNIYTSGTTTIDGGQITTGSVDAAQISATAINSTHITVSGANAINYATVGADASGAAATAVSVVTDNIYTAGTTTIDGGMVTTGSIKASKITIDDNIEFSNSASGIIFGKTSLNDGTPGAFYGRGEDGSGSSVAGFSISSTNSSLLMDSGGNFRMVNVGIFTGSPGVPQSFLAPSNNGSSAHIYNLPSGLTDLDIVVQGGGGGGSTNAAGDRPYKNSGVDGGFSRVQCYSGANGTGNLLSTIYSAGGAGAPWSVQTNLNTGVGAAGEASAKAAGGFGGPISTPSTPGDGSLGSGGGSGGAVGGNGSADAVTNNGGSAGENKNVSSVPSGTASLVLIVGAGGLGGAGGISNGSVITSGGDGGSGYIVITNPLGGGNEIDLVQIEADVAALTTGAAPSWNYQGSAFANNSQSITTSWGNGAGWYTIKGGIGNRHNDDPALQSYVSDARPWRTYFTGTPTCNGQYQQNQNTPSFSYTTAFYWYKEF